MIFPSFVVESLSKAIDYKCNGVFLDSQSFFIDLYFYPMPVPHYLADCIFVVILKWGRVSPSTLLFFFMIVLTILSLFHICNIFLPGSVLAYH